MLDLPRAGQSFLASVLPALYLSLVKDLLAKVCHCKFTSHSIGLLKEPVTDNRLSKDAAQLGGVPTEAAVEIRLQKLFFACQVVLVFLAETIAPVIPPIVGPAIADTLATSQLLAQALPTASDFFIQYIILDSFNTHCLLLS